MQVNRGPDSGSGTIFTWRTGNQDADPRFGYYPDKQKWIPSFANNTRQWQEGRYWIGLQNDSPLQPSDIARPNQIPGKKIMLADGFRWMLPTIQTLPHSLTLDSDGDVARKVKEEFDSFYKRGMGINRGLAEQWGMLEELRKTQPDIDDYCIETDIQGGAKLVIQAMCLNYRLSYEIPFMLDLVDEKTLATALVSFCELQEIALVSKKKRLGSPVTINVGSIT